MPKDLDYDLYSRLIEQAGSIEDEGWFDGRDGSTLKNYTRPLNDDDAEILFTSEDVKLGKVKVDDAGLISEALTYIDPDDAEQVYVRMSHGHDHKYTEQEMAEIRAGYTSTLVFDNSASSVFHMSDEERADRDTLIEVRIKLNSLKKMYRKVDQYIVAMRTVIEAWDILEKRFNRFHTKEEFYRLVAKGKIYNSSIIMPRLKGIDKYNIDTLIEYISNPELDPKDLAPVEKNVYDRWYSQFDDIDCETPEEVMDRVLSPEDLDLAVKYDDHVPDLEVLPLKKKYISGYDQRTRFGKKKKSKKTDVSIETTHALLKHIQKEHGTRSGLTGSFLVTNSLFETPVKTKDPWEDLRYHGSWASERDQYINDMEFHEKMSKMTIPGNKYKTYGALEMEEFYRVCEAHGINVIGLRRRKNQSKSGATHSEVYMARKENKKLESALLQRITKLNGNPKFKKLCAKAEKDVNKRMEGYQ